MSLSFIPLYILFALILSLFLLFAIKALLHQRRRKAHKDQGIRAEDKRMDQNGEVEPPWVEFPGHPPGDIFWRQEGSIWFAYVWKPYWDSLKAEEQETYLKRWDVPADWQRYYFDPEFQAWLSTVDDD